MCRKECLNSVQKALYSNTSWHCMTFPRARRRCQLHAKITCSHLYRSNWVRPGSMHNCLRELHMLWMCMGSQMPWPLWEVVCLSLFFALSSVKLAATLESRLCTVADVFDHAHLHIVNRMGACWSPLSTSFHQVVLPFPMSHMQLTMLHKARQPSPSSLQSCQYNTSGAHPLVHMPKRRSALTFDSLWRHLNSCCYLGRGHSSRGVPLRGLKEHHPSCLHLLHRHLLPPLSKCSLMRHLLMGHCIPRSHAAALL